MLSPLMPTPTQLSTLDTLNSWLTQGFTTKNGLYTLRSCSLPNSRFISCPSSQLQVCAYVQSTTPTTLWHRLLGHVNFQRLCHMTLHWWSSRSFSSCPCAMRNLRSCKAPSYIDSKDLTFCHHSSPRALAFRCLWARCQCLRKLGPTIFLL